MKKHHYEVGDIVIYSPFGGGRRRVLVKEKEEDIKNGRPGFAGVDLGVPDTDPFGTGVWGYDSQIISVEKK